MKKLFLFLMVCVCLQSCIFSHSHKQGYHAYFCTTTPSDEKRYLFIDKKRIGVLPYTDNVPDCDDVPSHKYTLYAKLSSGEHLVEIKNAEGDILFAEDLTVERSMSGSSISSTVEKPEWDTKVKVKDDHIVVELIH